MGKISFPGTITGKAFNDRTCPFIRLSSVQSIISFSGMAPNHSTISGFLQAWYNGSGLTVTTPGLSGAGTWNDRSTYARNANSFTSDPFVASGRANGYNAAYFTGSGCYVTTNLHTAFSGADVALTCIAVVEPQVISSASVFLGFGRATSNTPAFHMGFIENPTSGLRVFRRDDAASIVDMRKANGVTFRPIIISHVFSGTTINTYMDGALVSSSGMNVGTISLDRSTIGAQRGSTTVAFYTGFIWDMAIYSSGMSTTDRLEVEKWMSSQYDISLLV